MTEDAKKIIEDNIELIEEDSFDSWDAFFSNIEVKIQNNSLDAAIIPEIVQILSKCGINPLKELDYVPSGYYYQDPNVKTIILPDHIQNIKEYAFYGCDHLESLKLPYNLVQIEDMAFKHCHALEHIEIPINIEFIGNEAFSSCKNLKRILYSGTKEQLKDIEFEENIFDNCNKVSSISCLNGVVDLNEYGEPIF